ncbi:MULTISPECIES: hypothetical protein [unclassified Streptomyces]|uniref:hypothetical protein n=1 Tax=Streptomyces sp. NPDC055082 TaxID=3365718 RepID=UPI0037CFC226
MYALDTRRRTLDLVAQGLSLNSVSKQTGISRAAIRSWLSRIEPLPRIQGHAECPRCAHAPAPPADPANYAYLLGLYLGDGCISRHRGKDGYYLRIACADAWPGLIDECRKTIMTLQPAGTVYLAQQQGCVAVTSYSRHWPCRFPQHGPGKKHTRPIVLQPWQQEILDCHPWEFIRGLIHSDGCRVTKWATRRVGEEQRRYEYPRYFFTNLSSDITDLFTGSLDHVGVQWKQANARNISVARRASVALMDAHVGPKY